jgi:hypothetical protein
MRNSPTEALRLKSVIHPLFAAEFPSVSLPCRVGPKTSKIRAAAVRNGRQTPNAARLAALIV